jgi:hypothetical protein
MFEKKIKPLNVHFIFAAARLVNLFPIYDITYSSHPL